MTTPADFETMSADGMAFRRIRPRYGLLNRIVGMGLDRRWRRAAARVADLSAGGSALDLSCGTGHMTFALADRVGRAGAVVGTDLNDEKLQMARETAARDARTNVTFRHADPLALPFDDDAFDAATISLGARTLPDLRGTVTEMARVVRPGGRVVILELSPAPALRPVIGLWFDRILPRIGAALGASSGLYSEIWASAKRFPTPRDLAALMGECGISDVRWHMFTGRMAALHHGRVAS